MPQLRHQNTFQHLIQNLPLIYKQCREENTIKKYQQYFKIWKEWATAHQVYFLPAEPMHVALYLLSKIQAGHTFPTIDASFYAIKFFHKSLFNVDTCSHFFFVTNILEAGKRVTAHKTKKKKALSLDNLNKIFVKFNQSRSNLADQRLLTIILIAFCGFMRFSEVSRLRRSDFIFSSTYVKVFIEKSKTDIYREGMWVYISASSKICPLKQLKYYLALAKTSENSEEFIFKGLSRSKKFSLRTKNKTISYNRIRENFIKVLKAVNLDWRKYGLHSLRSGGASLAPYNGVSDRHGRWKSDKAKDRYIEDILESLLSLSVSKDLAT